MERCDIEAISALIDGELLEESAARLRGHLAECPSCRALADDLTVLKDGFALLEAEPPDTLAPGIMYKIGLGEDPPRRKRIIGSLVSVAACLIVLLVVSRVMDTPQSDSFYGQESKLMENAPALVPAPAGGADMIDDYFSAAEPKASLTGGSPNAATDAGGMMREDGDDIANAAPEESQKDWEMGSAANGFDYVSFISLLAANGLDYAEEEGYDEMLSVVNKPVWVGGEVINVYEYASYEDMEYDARHIHPGGAQILLPENRSKISWASYPYFYKRDLLIVLYVGEDDEMLGFLQENLGEPFAGYGHLNP